MSCQKDMEKLETELEQLKKKHAELEKDHQCLKAEHDQLTGIVNNLPGCVLFQIEVKGNETTFAYMGENAEENLGYTPAMALNDIMIPYSCLSKKDFDQFMLLSNEARANKSVFEWTGPHVHYKTGKSGKVRIRSKYRHISDDVFVYDGFTENIDYEPAYSAHNADKTNESIVNRLMTGVEQANDGIMMTADDGTIHYINPAFTKMTGYKLHDVVLKTPRVLKSGEQSASFYSELWKTISSGFVWKGRLVNRRKDGSYYLDETTITPVYNTKGKITNYISVKRDVTREVELEKQLMKSQKMEAVGTLAGGVAHDFNNILTAMLAFCVRAQDRNPEDEVVKHCLSKIKMATSRASNLVDQILAFSKGSDYEKRLINLCESVKECIRLLEVSFPGNIEFRIDGDEDVMVLADETHIHQIVMNLSTNACHSMDKHGGIVTIHIAKIDTQAMAHTPVDLNPGKYGVLTVTDTGSGIRQCDIERIFSPYFTTKKMGDGTGIGLSLVQKIVSQYEGYITVESAKGKGSSFNVYLPSASNQPAEKLVPSKSLSLLRGDEHILLVDDEAEIIEVLKPSLEELGYTVTGALGAKDARELFKNAPHSFHILVTDQILSRSIGSRLANDLKKIHPSLPVVICSGFSKIINEQIAIELGFNAFLKKPYDAFALAKIIRKTLDTV